MNTFRDKTNIATKIGPRKELPVPSNKDKKYASTMRQKIANYLGLLYKSRTLESSC